MSPSYSPRPSSSPLKYYSPPPPDCNMTKWKPPPPPRPPPPPPPPPPSPPDCNMSHSPYPPPQVYNCTCPPSPTYHPPVVPTPKTPDYYPPAPPPYIIKYEHNYKAVIAVSVSLGGFLVAFLLLGVFFLAKRKHKPLPQPPCEDPQPPATTDPPSYQYAPVYQPPPTSTVTYEAIEIQEEVAAAGDPSCEPPPVVVHDHGRHNYG